MLYQIKMITLLYTFVIIKVSFIHVCKWNICTLFCNYQWFSFEENTGLICYPSSSYVFGGSGERLRHVGVAVGSIEGAEGGRGAVRRLGERGRVWVCVTSKHKAAEGVAVSEDHHGLHQLRQRPALLACLQQRLTDRAQGQTRFIVLYTP